MKTELLEDYVHAVSEIQPILDKLRNGEMQDLPGPAISKELGILTGWHDRIGTIATEAHAEYITAQAVTEEAWGDAVDSFLKTGVSVNAAEKLADASRRYLGAKKLEANTNSDYRRKERKYRIVVEAMQSLKKIHDAIHEEEKHLGRD